MPDIYENLLLEIKNLDNSLKKKNNKNYKPHGDYFYICLFCNTKFYSRQEIPEENRYCKRTKECLRAYRRIIDKKWRESENNPDLKKNKKYKYITNICLKCDCKFKIREDLRIYRRLCDKCNNTNSKLITGEVYGGSIYTFSPPNRSEMSDMYSVADINFQGE